MGSSLPFPQPYYRAAISRPLRIEFPGAVYHVTSRGDRRELIYRSDDDRILHLAILAQAMNRFDAQLLAYCLMGNHFHLVLHTRRANLSRLMRHVNGVYTQSFNRRHGLAGHVFQGRYKALFVEHEAYLLEVARYVVLNPVRAAMVRAAVDWPWSSYRDTAGHRSAPAWLATEAILSQFATRQRAAVTAYRAFVAAGKGQPSPWSALKNELYLGSEQFVHDLLLRLDERTPLRDIPQAQRRPIARALEAYTREHLGRDAAMVAAYRSGNYTLQQIGEHFGLHYSRVSRIVRKQRDSKTKGKL